LLCCLTTKKNHKNTGKGNKKGNERRGEGKVGMGGRRGIRLGRGRERGGRE